MNAGTKLLVVLILALIVLAAPFSQLRSFRGQPQQRATMAADAAATQTLFRCTRRTGLEASLALVVCPRAARAVGDGPGPGERVLVMGGTGRSGIEVVRELLQDDRFDPIVHVRNRSAMAKASAASLWSGLEIVECDVTSPDASAVLAEVMHQHRVRSVICTLGFVPSFVSVDDGAAAEAIDHKGIVAVIRAAETAGLTGRFMLVSSLLTSTKPGTRNLSAQLLNSLGGVLDAKGLSEQRLQHSTLDYTILRPGVFADTLQGPLLVGGSGRFIGDEKDGLRLGGPVGCQTPFMASSGAVCSTTRRQLAEACVRVLGDSGASRMILELVARPDAPPPGQWVPVSFRAAACRPMSRAQYF